MAFNRIVSIARERESSFEGSLTQEGRTRLRRVLSLKGALPPRGLRPLTPRIFIPKEWTFILAVKPEDRTGYLPGACDAFAGWWRRLSVLRL
jgi:hypothetical protein